MLLVADCTLAIFLSSSSRENWIASLSLRLTVLDKSIFALILQISKIIVLVINKRIRVCIWGYHLGAHLGVHLGVHLGIRLGVHLKYPLNDSLNAFIILKLFVLGFKTLPFIFIYIYFLWYLQSKRLCSHNFFIARKYFLINLYRFRRVKFIHGAYMLYKTPY